VLSYYKVNEKDECDFYTKSSNRTEITFFRYHDIDRYGIGLPVNAVVNFYLEELEAKQMNGPDLRSILKHKKKSVRLKTPRIQSS
jgi:hypothetical protein